MIVVDGLTDRLNNVTVVEVRAPSPPPSEAPSEAPSDAASTVAGTVTTDEGFSDAASVSTLSSSSSPKSQDGSGGGEKFQNFLEAEGLEQNSLRYCL